MRYFDDNLSIFFYCTLSLIGGCSSTPSRKTDTQLRMTHTKQITYDELVTKRYSLPSTNKKKEKRKQFSKEEITKCQKKYNAHVPAIKKLFNSYKHKKRIPENPRQALATMSTRSCHTKKGAEYFYQLMHKLEKKSSYNTAFILPLTGTSKNLGKNYNKGISSYLNSSKRHQSQFVTINNGSEGNEIDFYIARAYFEFNADIVVGGTLANEVPKMIEWSSQLQLPTIILSNTKDAVLGDYCFQVYPYDKNIWNKVANITKYRKARSIAIIYPTDFYNNHYIKGLKRTLSTVVKKPVKIEHYEPNNNASIETTLKKIFSVIKNEDDVFNPTEQFDAMYVIGDFRTTRYISKIMRFLNIKKTIIIGTQSWRSKSLLSSYEQYIDGAYFVDILPSYHKLNKGLNIPYTDEGIFAPFQVMVEADQKVIGYIASYLSEKAVANARKHRSLSESIKNQSLKNVSVVGKAPIFDATNRLNWKAFSFQVIRNRIIELNY